MRAAPRITDAKLITRWLPRLERLESREVPAVTAALSQVANWTELGPNVISNGQVSNITSVDPNGGPNVSNPVIGTISALVAHPTNANIMYAGTPNGGVWRTTNAQAANPIWTPLTDDLATMSISDLSLDPANPNRLIVGIGGTADGAEVEQTGVVRGDLVGVLVTEDATVATPSWRLVGGQLANKNITKAVIRGSVWVIGTDQGLFRSIDNGVTFNNIFSSTINNGVTYQDRQFNSRVYDIAQNTRLPNQLYVATEPFAGLGREVWRTDDGGITWGNVTDAQMQLSNNTTSVKLSVRDAGPFDNQVYVSVVNSLPTGAQQSLPGVGVTFAFANRVNSVSSVCWSTNQGGNWTRMDNPRRMTAAEGLDLGYRRDLDPFQGGGLRDDGGRILVVTDEVYQGSLRGDGWPHRLKTGDWVHIAGVTNYPPTDPPNPPPQDTIFDLNNGNTNFFQIEVRDDYSFWLLDVDAPNDLMNSINAFWQRVEDATPGEVGFLDIVAAPATSGENIVYLGGDFNNYRFDKAGTPSTAGIAGPFPSTFSGSIWQGNRFTVPNGKVFTANQWSNLADGGTGNLSAPGGDTREMLFDANGNLWVATGTGVYRRSVTAGSNWTNASGNIRATQFWGVGFDNHNNLAVGATQDTGIVEQNVNTPGNLGFSSPLNRVDRTFYTDQDYSYEVAVDNTSDPNQVTRYYVSSAFGFRSLGFPSAIGSVSQGGIVRRIYNNSGTLLSSSTLNLANALTTNVPLSGISDADIALGQDTSARVVMELNTNDRRRAAYGLTRVYEDSDPLGPGSSPVTGFVVSDVTPAGMTGRVRAMSYGGKRAGINFNQVMFVGTTTGQLWVRGEFGTQFTQVAPGTGPVTDIQLDPDDYRHAFIAQGGQVWETTNLGVTWNNVSVGLVSAPNATTGLPSLGGLTTQIYTIALFDPNPGTADVGATNDVRLLAGGRGGVFRRTLSVCGTSFVWSEYGSNLPNTVVMDLELEGTRLTAGTFGRGVWSIPDVTPTLTQTLFLDIIGDGGDNTISIQSDPLDPNAVIVSDGLGLNARFSFGQFDSIRVFGLGGADTVVFDGNGPTPGGNLRFINYPVNINTGGDVGDRIILDASSDPNNIVATVTGTTVGAATGDTLFSGCGSITYSGLQNGLLVLRTGNGNDTIIVTNGPLPPQVALDGGAGNDTYVLSSVNPGGVFISDPSGVDTIAVTIPAGQTAYVDGVNRTLVAGGLVVLAGPGIESLVLDAQAPGATVAWNAGTGSDTAYLMSEAPGWSLLQLGSFGTRFRNMNSATVNMLGGADTLVVDSNGSVPGGNTQFVTYALTANMGGDANDTLIVNSPSTTTAISAIINGATIGANIGVDTLFGTGGYLNHTGLSAGALYVTTGSGNDVLYFDSTAPLFAIVDGGTGTDQVWALGTAGNDTFSAVNNAFFAGNLRIGLATNTEQFVAAGGGGPGDQLFTQGTAAANGLTITQTGLQSGVVGGIVVPTAYFNVQNVAVDGAGGTDSLDWLDASNTVFGVASNPATGLVYAPTGPNSGVLALGNGGTTVRFANVSGNFTANGDPFGSNTGDVFSVLGVSSSALGSANGELTAANGSDTINANENGVTITNATVGALKPVNFGRTPGGFLGFSTVMVRGGNETGTGDSFATATTLRTNLLLDGGDPSSQPGDSLSITTNGPASSSLSTNPLLGPPHTRVTSRADQSAVGYLNFEQVTTVTADPNNPGGPPIPSLGSRKSDLFAVGTDSGVQARVRVYNLDGSLRFELAPFGAFTGGVRVAVGDVTGDGRSDVVVAAAAGGSPIVKVYNGATGAEVRSFFAYDPAFAGGVTIAVGNFNTDAFADIVTGSGPGGGPHVKLFDGATGAETLGFFAYASNFSGGVSVAAGDVNNDGLSDFVTGPLSGGGPHVRVFDGRTTGELLSLFAFDPSFVGGVNVAAGDITGDGKADLIVGAGPGGATQVRVFDAANGSLIRDFVVNDPTIPGTPPIPVTGGVRVAAGDFDGDGLYEVVTGRGRTSRPFAQVLKVSTISGGSVEPSLTSLLAVNTFGDAYSNGIFVGV